MWDEWTYQGWLQSNFDSDCSLGYYAWLRATELEAQQEAEYRWFLRMCCDGQRLMVRVILPNVRMAARWVVLHLRSAPRWRRGRWRAKT